MRLSSMTILALGAIASLGAQTEPSTAPTPQSQMGTAEAQSMQAPHDVPDRMSDAEAMAMMQAMQSAELPDPGEGGFLTPAEEEAVRGYFESLMAIDAQIQEVLGGRQVTEVTDEMVTELVANLSEMSTFAPPTLAHEQANTAFATFHSSLTQMGQALGEFIQEMPRGEITPEMHQEMVPAANALQERMRGIMTPMMTSAQQVEQIVTTDLGESPMDGFGFGGLIN